MGTAIRKCVTQVWTFFVISRYQNDNCHGLIVPVHVLRSRLAERTIVPKAFDVMILYLSQDNKFSSCGLFTLQIRTMDNFETEVDELLKLYDQSR